MPRGRPTRASVYARLDAALEELHHRLGGLPSPDEAGYVWRDIWHLEAHHSTALEGNTLVIREVEALLEKGRAVGAKPLKEYLEEATKLKLELSEAKREIFKLQNQKK